MYITLITRDLGIKCIFDYIRTKTKTIKETNNKKNAANQTLFFLGRPLPLFFGVDVLGFDACTAVFRGLPLFFFGAEVEDSASGAGAFAGLPLFFFGAEVDGSASAIGAGVFAGLPLFLFSGSCWFGSAGIC